jgi:dephospho-CoA kinase
LENLGIPVFYADKEAKNMYEDDAEVQALLVKAFGEAIYRNGTLDRKRLAQKVFNSASALATLNAIAHPAVAKRFDRWVAQQHAPCVAQEAALIFESNAHLLLNSVIAVSAPKELRIWRVMQRDGCTRSDVLRRMAQQLSDNELSSRADFCIVNDDATLLLPQILMTLRDIGCLGAGKL